MFEYLKKLMAEILCFFGYHDKGLLLEDGYFPNTKCKRCDWVGQRIRIPEPPIMSECKTAKPEFPKGRIIHESAFPEPIHVNEFRTPIVTSRPAPLPTGVEEAMNLIKTGSPEYPKMYILIREDTPADLVPLIATHTQMLTYKKFARNNLMQWWFETSLQRTVICKVNTKTFEEAKKYGEYFALTEVHHVELGELGLGFDIQAEYPKFFKFLKLYTV